ncbi:MAG: Gfo/Idh/MocA family oxidoreductase [Sedimentisphaerales bacterium]|nr:Gfo/Idh/MocA family oxidoreductase [Sedimentisphaerales bacterium]
MKTAYNKSKEAKMNLSRRDFVRGIAAAGAFTIVPRSVLGGAGNTPPSEKLNIAAIGAGGRGADNLRGLESENIVALCDVDFKQAAATFRRYPDAKKYRDFRRMLDAEKGIDAVMVATPDHVHAIATLTAIKLGKHVYCEKPLTHTVKEARLVAEAARKYKVATQMGIQGHSGEGIRLLAEWIADGAIGEVREVHSWTDRPKGWWPQGVARPEDTPPAPETLDWDLWLGPAPQRPYNPAYVPFRWRGWWDFGTGPLGDMGIHNSSPIFQALKLGYPTSIEPLAQKGCNKETGPENAIVRYEFPARGSLPGVTLTWYDGGNMPPRPEELEEGRPFGDSDGGSLFIGSKGKILAPGWCAESPRIIPETKMKAYKLPPKTIPRSPGHYAEWIAACKTGSPTTANFQFAGRLTEVMLAGNIAVRTGRKLTWDGPNMTCTNVPEANEYVHCSYRKGWEL